jgi:hypothetical protein
LSIAELTAPPMVNSALPERSADAGDVDDRTAVALQIGPRGARDAHRRHELEPEAVGPVLLGELEEVAAFRRAGVVDHHIDAAEHLGRGRDQGRAGARLPQVGDLDEHPAPRPLDLALDPLELARVARRDRDVHAFVGQARRDGAPDALARARDDRRLTAQIQIHGFSTSPYRPCLAHWASFVTAALARKMTVALARRAVG